MGLGEELVCTVCTVDMVSLKAGTFSENFPLAVWYEVGSWDAVLPASPAFDWRFLKNRMVAWYHHVGGSECCQCFRIDGIIDDVELGVMVMQMFSALRVRFHYYFLLFVC